MLDPESGQWQFRDIPYQDANAQWEHYEVNIDIQGAKGATADMALKVRGLGAAKIRRVLRSQEQADKFYAILASHFPGCFTKRRFRGKSYRYRSAFRFTTKCRRDDISFTEKSRMAFSTA